MPEPTVPTEEQLVAFADDLLLVEEFEVLTIAGFRIGTPGSQPIVALRFSGRVNNTDRHAEHNIALSPADAAALMRTIVASYSGSGRPRDAFGRPQ